ncbi:hypothetical protein D3C78_1920910 [compost metagenome]
MERKKPISMKKVEAWALIRMIMTPHRDLFRPRETIRSNCGRRTTAPMEINMVLAWSTT